MTAKKKLDGTEELDQAGVPAAILEAQQSGGDVTVTLAHHWTDPETGKNALPGSTVTVSADLAASMAAGGFLVRETGKK
jgi:hypothetical protein